LWEESGLAGVVFVGVVDGRGRGFVSSKGLRVRRFSVVAVLAEGVEWGEGPGGRGGWVNVTVDPKEHQDWVWATEDEVAAARFDDRELVFTSEDERRDILAVFHVLKDSKESS
jgi:hypothetical protein